MRDLMLAAIALDALVEHRMSFGKLLHLVPQGLEENPSGTNPLVEDIEPPAHTGQAVV